jgi:hypothetical protein
MHWIKNAEYKKDYEIGLEFENGDVKIVNLESHHFSSQFTFVKNGITSRS